MIQQQLKSEPSTEAVYNHAMSLSQTTSFEEELMCIPFFERVRRENGMSSLTRLAVVMSKRNYSEDEEISYANNNKRQFVYILQGAMHLFGHQTSSKSLLEPKQVCTSQPMLIATLRRDSYFGHSEFMNECRITRAVAASRTKVILVPLNAMYLSLRGLLYFPELQEKLDFIRRVSLFGGVDAAEIERVVIASETLQLRKGLKLYEEGTQATHIYIVLYGTFEVVRKTDPSNHLAGQEMPVSCIGEYQTLGTEDLFLENRHYSQTVHCVSMEAAVLKIPNELFVSLIHNKNNVKKLCRSRQIWRRSRVEKLEKTFSTQFPASAANRRERIRSTASLATKQRIHTEPLESTEGIEGERCLSRHSHLTSKKVQFFRSEEEYLNYKYQEMKRADSANIQCRGAFELRSTETSRPVTHQHSRNMSELVLTKFLNKKSKQQNRMIFQYLKTRPPELILNSNKEFAIFKPLHVMESAAVRNQKRSIARIKARYFQQPSAPRPI